MLWSLLALALPSPADTLTYSGRDGRLTVEPPRMESPSITIDGRLDEPEWADAAVLSGFTQYTPVEGIAAAQDTEVRVFYSGDAIYFGFHAYDSDPSGILAFLTERDRSSFGNDWVRVMLDTFDDQRQAYAFFVNPYGIQTDGLWLESLPPAGGVPTNPKVDFNIDYIWDSQGRLVEDGWVAELRIPYVSLRFPDRPVHQWGLQIARGVTRSDFKSSWAPLTLDISSVLAQSGRLVGIHDIHPKRLVQINPEVTGSITGARVGGAFERGDPDPAVGLNARYGLTPNLVLDATFNPDFSQVEADVDQIQTNERFALFLPERRPFFLDGAEIFLTTQRLVHTRSVVDPIGGARLSGKVGSFAVAWLGAVDESPTSVFGGQDDALFNLVRVRRDVGAGSTLGFLYTDRTLNADVYNRVLSTDVRLLFGGRYALQTQLTGSWTATGVPGESTGLKPMATFHVDRSSRSSTLQFKLEDTHPEFRALSGFIPRVGDTEMQAIAGFTRYGRPGALVERWGSQIRYNSFYRHDTFWDGGSPFEWEVELWPSIAVRGARSLTAIVRVGGFDFQPGDFARYQVVDANGQSQPFPQPPAVSPIWGLALLPNIRINDRVRLTGRSFFREVPLYAEGSQGWEIQLAPTLEITPDQAWRVDLNHTWAHLTRSADGSDFGTVHISRAAVQYQFGRSVFARVIAQYDLERREALRHPVTGQAVLVDGQLADVRSRGDFQSQVLLSWEPSPGTIFFVGYSRAMDGPYGYALSRKDPVTDGVFVKLSWLFRL
ncbi:MAG: DUF5916 domain-containing protein [Gemmatimonadota bacterium]